MQSEPGILPSTSFCHMPSATLSSGQQSPELEPDSQSSNEGLLNIGKGKTAGRPSDVSDSSRRFAGMWPNKLRPLLVSKFSRPCQILTDVEKILGKGPSFTSFDVDIHQDQDTSVEMQDRLCLDSSDSQSDDLEVRPSVQSFCVPKKACFQDLENVKTLLEVPADKILLFGKEKLKEKWKMKEVIGESVCVPDDDLLVREKSTGPGGDEGRSPGLLRDYEKGPSPESVCVNFMMDFCGKYTAQKSNGAEVPKEVKKGDGRTNLAPRVWGEEFTEDSKVPPVCLCQMFDCQGSKSAHQHMEVELTQTRKTAENYGKMEVSEGEGRDEIGLQKSPL
ncbi:uncharacterized protein [Apteryx mantelli]|uniref:Uncharacterized protein n=1 Tax=Apteryx mantelli TaxID=2696672 RepID=A0ABM4FN42_9AVES